MPEIDYDAVYGVREFPLAPLGHRFPRLAESKEEQGFLDRQNDIESYQRRLLEGFTTQELIDLDAHSTRQLKAPTLKNPLHSLFIQSRWQTQESLEALSKKFALAKKLYPINSNNPLPYTGNWEASNPHVWKILEPALRLTSKMLISLQVMPFLRTLLLGEIDEAPKRLWPDGYNYHRLDRLLIVHHLKGIDPSIAAEKAAEARDSHITELLNYFGITFDFLDRGREGLEEKKDNPDKSQKNHGLTRGVRVHHLLQKVLVYLQTDDIEGLLRHNPPIVPDSDTFGAHFFIAITLLHEMMHALWYIRKNHIVHKLPSDDRGIILNPLIEGEAALEHGWSMESSEVFGGIIKGLLNSEEGGRLAYLFYSFPSLRDIGILNPRETLKEPPLSPKVELFLSTVYMHEQLQQEEFWDVAVRSYGFKQIIQLGAPRKWSKVYAKVKDSSGNEYAARIQKSEDYNTSRGEYIEQFDKNYPTMELAAMTPQERAHIEWAQGFIASSKSMGDFWQTQKYRTSTVVQEIMALLEKPGRGASKAALTRAAKKYKFIIKPLEEAVSAHEKAVTAILTVDLSVPSVSIAPLLSPQRRSLLLWNQGTRVFIHNITKKLQSDDIAEVEMLENIELNLDYCRILLTKPTADNDIGLGEQYQTMNLVKTFFYDAVSGDRLKAFKVAADCNKIMLDDEEASLFDKLCARIISCSISFAPPSGLVKTMGKVCNQLDKLRGADREGGIYDKEWTDIMMKWRNLAQIVKEGVQLPPENRPKQPSVWLGTTCPNP